MSKSSKEDSALAAMKAEAQQRQCREAELHEERECGLHAIFTLLKCCDFANPAGDFPGRYDEIETDMISLERRDESLPVDAKRANRKLCRVWVDKFWHPAALHICKALPREVVLSLPARTPLHEATQRLFLPLLTDQSPTLIAATVRAVARMRQTLGGRSSGLEAYFAQLALHVYDMHADFYHPHLYPDAEGLLDPSGLPHLDAERDDQIRTGWTNLSSANSPEDLPRASDDFTWVWAKEEMFTFRKGNQADVVRELWREWEKAGRHDGATLHQDDIGRRIDSDDFPFRPKKLFAGSPALGNIICSPQKGLWALYLNSTHGK